MGLKELVGLNFVLVVWYCLNYLVNFVVVYIMDWILSLVFYFYGYFREVVKEGLNVFVYDLLVVNSYLK